MKFKILFSLSLLSGCVFGDEITSNTTYMSDSETSIHQLGFLKNNHGMYAETTRYKTDSNTGIGYQYNKYINWDQFANARVSVSEKGLKGNGEFRDNYSENIGYGVVVERDLVDTESSVDDNVYHNFVAGYIEHDWILSSTHLLGVQVFDDDNTRYHVRNAVSYRIPDSPIVLGYVGRAYFNTLDWSEYYFNPESYHSHQMKLSIRKFFGGHMLYGSVGMGNEYVDSQSNGIKTYQFAYKSPIQNGWYVNSMYSYSSSTEELHYVSVDLAYKW